MGEIYPFEYAATLKLESFRSDVEYIQELIDQENEKKEEAAPEDNKGKSDKDKSKKGAKKVKDILFRLLPCLHQGMVDQLLKDNNIGPNSKVNDTHIPLLQKITQDTLAFLR